MRHWRLLIKHYLHPSFRTKPRKRKMLRMRSTENKTCLMLPVNIRYRPSKIHNQRTTKIWMLMNKCLLRKRKRLRKKDQYKRTIPTEILRIRQKNVRLNTMAR